MPTADVGLAVGSDPPILARMVLLWGVTGTLGLRVALETHWRPVLHFVFAAQVGPVCTTLPLWVLFFGKAGTTQNRESVLGNDPMLLPLSSGWDSRAESIQMGLA